MADLFLRKINRNASVKDIIEYLDYLCDKLESNFENIEFENLSNDLQKRIGGEDERRR